MSDDPNAKLAAAVAGSDVAPQPPAPSAASRAKSVANTHTVGYSGLALIALGLFGPAIVDAYAHVPQPIVAAVHAFGDALVLAGGGAAYSGRPAFVKSDAPANPPNG